VALFLHVRQPRFLVIAKTSSAPVRIAIQSRQFVGFVWYDVLLLSVF
jgi:hypothetical protein